MENHKEDQEKKELEEKLDIDAVVIKKVPAGVRTIQMAIDIVRVLVNAILAIFILALLSLAVTVLINEPLRQMVFDYLGFIKV